MSTIWRCGLALALVASTTVVACQDDLNYSASEVQTPTGDNNAQPLPNPNNPDEAPFPPEEPIPDAGPNGLLWSSNPLEAPVIEQTVPRWGGGLHLLMSWRGLLDLGPDGVLDAQDGQGRTAKALLSFDEQGTLLDKRIVVRGQSSTRGHILPLNGGDIILSGCAYNEPGQFLPDSAAETPIAASSCGLALLTPGQEAPVWQAGIFQGALTSAARLTTGEVMLAMEHYASVEAAHFESLQNRTELAINDNPNVYKLTALVRMSPQGQHTVLPAWQGEVTARVAGMTALEDGGVALCGRLMADGFEAIDTLDLGNGVTIETTPYPEPIVSDLFFARLERDGQAIWGAKMISMSYEFEEPCHLNYDQGTIQAAVLYSTFQAAYDGQTIDAFQSLDFQDNMYGGWLMIDKEDGALQEAITAGRDIRRSVRWTPNGMMLAMTASGGEAPIGDSTLPAHPNDSHQTVQAGYIDKDGRVLSTYQGRTHTPEAYNSYYQGLVAESDGRVLVAATLYPGTTLDPDGDTPITIEDRGDNAGQPLVLWRQALQPLP